MQDKINDTSTVPQARTEVMLFGIRLKFKPMIKNESSGRMGTNKATVFILLIDSIS
jgi:hypothetical protein